MVARIAPTFRNAFPTLGFEWFVNKHNFHNPLQQHEPLTHSLKTQHLQKQTRTACPHQNTSKKRLSAFINQKHATTSAYVQIHVLLKYLW